MTFRDIISAATTRGAQSLLKGLTGVESSSRSREGAVEVKSEYWWGKLQRCSIPTQQDIDTHTHTHACTPTDVPKLQNITRVCRWRRSATHSLFNYNFNWQTEISFSRIQTRTMRRSHVNVDVMRSTHRTRRREVTYLQRVCAAITHKHAQKKTLCSALIITIYTHQHFSFHSDYAARRTL